MNWFRLKGCGKCGGDLVLDEGDWLCLQCGTYYYTGLYLRTGLRRGWGKGSPPERPEKSGVASERSSNLGQVSRYAVATNAWLAAGPAAGPSTSSGAWKSSAAYLAAKV